MVKNKKLRAVVNGPLRDAKHDLVLTIKDSDIKDAERESNDHCAAANALCRQEHLKQAMVHKTKTYVLDRSGVWWRYITPGDLYVYLMAFDLGAKFPSGLEFILKAPRGVERLGAHYKPKGRGGQTGKPPRKMHIIQHVRANAPKGPGLVKALFG